MQEIEGLSEASGNRQQSSESTSGFGVALNS